MNCVSHYLVKLFLNMGNELKVKSKLSKPVRNLRQTGMIVFT